MLFKAREIADLEVPFGMSSNLVNPSQISLSDKVGLFLLMVSINCKLPRVKLLFFSASVPTWLSGTFHMETLPNIFHSSCTYFKSVRYILA